MQTKNLLLKKTLSALLALTFIIGCIPVSIFAAPVTDYVNVASGCDYIISHTPQYGDSGNELTDGIVGAVNYSDSKWVGWSGVPVGTMANVIIDLGVKREFDKVSITALDADSGGIRYPAGDLIISYSDEEDGPFNVFTSGGFPATAPFNSVYTLDLESNAVEGRFVKVEFNAKNWSFIGEIEVFGNITVEPVLPTITTDIASSLDVNEGDPINFEVDASVTDAGTVTYQWYKDDVALTGETDKELFIYPAYEEDTGKYYCAVTNNFNSLTKTVNSTVCDVVVYPAGLTLETPTIDTDLSATLDLDFRDKLELRVEASNTDGGTLSYQWYKDDVPVGNNSNTYTVASAKVADSGVYKVVVTNTKEVYNKSVTSTECAVTVAPVVSENIISGITYQTNADEGSYDSGGDYHNSHLDDGHVKLTDGNRATSWKGDTVGFHSSIADGYLELTFNLPEEKGFKEIQLSSFNNSNEGLYNPRNIRIEALINDVWEIIFDGSDRKYDNGHIIEVFAVPDDIQLMATAIRFSLSDYGAWLFMDEIEVFSDLTGATPTGKLKIMKENNLAANATYEYSRADAWGDYPDTDNKELVDGILGSLSYTDAKWVGYAGVFFVTFDLGARSTFSEFRATFLNNPGPAIQIPEIVSVSYSDDNANWTTITTDTLIAPSADTLYDYVVTTPEKVSARYVRMEIVKARGWTFMGEVQVLRNPLSNPEADDNNIALRRVYDSTIATENEDPNRKELTDGNFANAYYLNEAWTGYAKASENTEIVIDLGAFRTFEQVDVRFLHDPENEIYLPGTMDVFVSDDNISFRELGRVTIPALETPAITASTYSYPLGQQETAKFVKLVFPADEKVYIDEIEVLENQTFFDQTPDEDYVDTNNIAFGAAYTTSWNAVESYPDTDKAELTDGKRGTYLYSNVNWAGYDVEYDGVYEKPFEIVVDLGEVKDFEQIQIGLLKSASVNNSIYVPENIKVEYSNDGNHWNLYANQGYYDVEDGVNRINYTLDGEKVSAQYVKFTLTVTDKFFIDEVSVYEEMMPYGDYETEPDKGASYNLILNKSYDLSRSADYRHTAGLLTDGLYMQSATKYDGNWTGFLRDETRVHFNKIEFVVDMEATNSVSEIIIHSKNDAANNLTTPKKVKVYASHDGVTWDEFGEMEDVTDEGEVTLTWNGERDGFTSKGGTATKVYTKYIKVYFETPKEAGVYVCLDEIQVIGQKGQTSDADYVASASGYGNLALGKKYYSIPSSQLTSQPDIDEIQLTDGIRGDVTDDTDPAWVVINQDYNNIPKHQGSKTVIQGYVIDLGKEMYVSNVKVKFISKGFSGTTRYPWTVWTYATNDVGDECPAEWFMLSRQWDVGKAWNSGTNTYGWRSGWSGKKNADGSYLYEPDTIEGYTTVKTRYVRVDIEIMSASAIDEIEVFGYETPQDNAYVVTDVRDLDNGRDYLIAGDQTGGVQDMVLCYNGWYGYDAVNDQYKGDWQPYQYRPYLTYIDKEGKAVDKMFDAVCLLALGDRVGGSYNGDVNNKYFPQTADTWYWYLDKTFDPKTGDVVNLAKAAEIAAEELGDPDYKIKLVVMHPGADRKNSDAEEGLLFGPLDGEYYDVALDDANGSDYYKYPTGENKKGWQKVSDWWFNEVIERFEKGKADGIYDRIEFVGFYYLSEQVGYTPAVPKYHIDRAHALGYKMYWIPFNHANGALWNDDMEFDGVAIQPNHFFDDPFKDGGQAELGNDYIDTVAYSANYGNVGIEMECDSRFNTNVMKFNQWIDYLNGVYDNGMDGDKCYRNWYEGTKAFALGAFSESASTRATYDYAYQVIKGTYTPKNYISDLGFVPTDRVGDDEIFEQTGGTGFTGDQFEKEDTPVGGGGSYYDTPSTPVRSEETTVPEEAGTPSYEGYSWKEYDGVYKYEDADGKYVTGWAKINNVWYYFNYRGEMATGWIKLNNVWYYLDKDGAMQTGWLKDNGKWYYLYDWGGMANNQWVLDNNTWYYTRGNGELFTGWFHEGNTWYYLKSSGAMAKGWNWIGGSCYYFYEDGRMAANTTIDNYKVNASGAWIK